MQKLFSSDAHNLGFLDDTFKMYMNVPWFFLDSCSAFPLLILCILYDLYTMLFHHFVKIINHLYRKKCKHLVELFYPDCATIYLFW